MLRRLTLSSMQELHVGQAEAAFKRLIEQVVKDCIDRPGVSGGRKVLLQLTVKPIASIRGTTIDCEGASGVLTLKAKIPDYETDEVNFGVQQDGSLIFNSDCPNNVRQQTIFDDEESDGD